MMSKYNAAGRQSSAPDTGAPLKLMVANVDTVLDKVRPYLITDGGNVLVWGVALGKARGGGKGGTSRSGQNVYLCNGGGVRVLGELGGDDEDGH